MSVLMFYPREPIQVVARFETGNAKIARKLNANVPGAKSHKRHKLHQSEHEVGKKGY